MANSAAPKKCEGVDREKRHGDEHPGKGIEHALDALVSEDEQRIRRNQLLLFDESWACGGLSGVEELIEQPERRHHREHESNREMASHRGEGYRQARGPERVGCERVSDGGPNGRPAGRRGTAIPTVPRREILPAR